MTFSESQNILRPQRLVIKLGSLAVTTSDGEVNEELLTKLAKEIKDLKEKQTQVVLVSSGAINAGKGFFSAFDSNEISHLQGASAIGQPLLMSQYQKKFSEFGLRTAQVLVTHDDLRDQKRYLNIRNTIITLLEHDIVPILNENDSVSFAEITVGDNDQLAAMLTALIEGDLLIMLTSSNGLYDRDPKDPEARHFKEITVDQNFENFDLLSKTAVGRGGMKTKLEAVRKLTGLGISVIISSFNDEGPINMALAQESGTFFHPEETGDFQGKKAKIYTTVKPGAEIHVDEGAFMALRKNGSLLPIGIKKVAGSFHRGDSVKIMFDQKEFAVGLSEFNSLDIQLIKGKKSLAIKGLLGETAPSNVVIHRNNMFIKFD